MSHQPQGARYPQKLKLPSRDGSHRPPGPEDVLDDASGAEVPIDFNHELRSEHVSIGSVHVSSCERFVAWTEDRTGEERFVLRLRRVAEKAGRTLEIPNSSATAVFSKSGEQIYVLHLDELTRPHEVWRYRTSDVADRERVLAENDVAFRLRVERSLSNAFIFITATNRDTTKNFYLNSTELDPHIQSFPENSTPSRMTTASQSLMSAAVVKTAICGTRQPGGSQNAPALPTSSPAETISYEQDGLMTAGSSHSEAARVGYL